MIRRRRLAALLVSALVAVTSSTGCTADDPPADPPSAPPTTTADGLTAPGTVLDLGETARVTSTNGSTVLDITVASIAEGNADDLTPEAREASTPFYATIEATFVSGDVSGFALIEYLFAWVGDDSIGSMAYGIRFPPCNRQDFPFGATPGTTILMCHPYLAPVDGPPVDRVTFSNRRDYSDTDGTEITWRASGSG